MQSNQKGQTVAITSNSPSCSFTWVENGAPGTIIECNQVNTIQAEGELVRITMTNGLRYIIYYWYNEQNLGATSALDLVDKIQQIVDCATSENGVPLSGQNYVTVPTVNTADYATDIATNAAAALAGLNEAIQLAVDDSMTTVVLNLEAGDYEELILPAISGGLDTLIINGAGKYATNILSLDLSLWEGTVILNDLSSFDFIFAATNEIYGYNVQLANSNSTDVNLTGSFFNTRFAGTWCDDAICYADFQDCTLGTLCPNGGQYYGISIKGGSINAFCINAGAMQSGYLENVTIGDMTGATVAADAEIRGGCNITNFLGNNGYLLGKVKGGKITAPATEFINVSNDAAEISDCDVTAERLVLTDDVTKPHIVRNKLTISIGAISITSAETAQIGWNEINFTNVGLPNLDAAWDSSNLTYTE